jgi:hypothetical protein
VEQANVRALLALLVVLSFHCGTAAAQSVQDILTRHLYGGTSQKGAAELAALSASTQDDGTKTEAKAAEGILTFIAGVEKLGQSLYRYGLEPQRDFMFVSLPILRFPVPHNPNPEKLDYDRFRQIAVTLVDDLDKAEASLASAGDHAIKFKIEPMRVVLDINNDGKPQSEESLAMILHGLSGVTLPPGIQIGFDNADIYWLRGYGRLISASAQFGLAFDFAELFNNTFHLFFPRSGLAVGDGLKSAGAQIASGDGGIADVIAFIHLVNAPINEPERLADVRMRLKAVVTMSLKSWESARAETDNDGEWLPNARQTSAFIQLPVTEDEIDNWIAVMKELDLILDGKKLLGHWRFTKGINVRRFFESSNSFDLVMLITGAAALPFLEDGTIVDMRSWAELTGPFGANFMNYGVWFN